MRSKHHYSSASHFSRLVYCIVLAGLVRCFINRAKLNDYFPNTGLEHKISQFQPNQTLADIAARVVFWLLWVNIIFCCANNRRFQSTKLAFFWRLGIPSTYIGSLPNYGWWCTISAIYWALGANGIAATGIEFHETFGKGTRLFLLVIVFITASEALGIDHPP